MEDWRGRMKEEGATAMFVWLSAPHDYEHLTLECQDQDGVQFLLNREEGLDRLVVELFAPGTSDVTELKKIEFDRLIELLHEAKKRMLHRYSENWDPRESAFYPFGEDPDDKK